MESNLDRLMNELASLCTSADKLFPDESLERAYLAQLSATLAGSMARIPETELSADNESITMPVMLFITNVLSAMEIGYAYAVNRGVRVDL